MRKYPTLSITTMQRDALKRWKDQRRVGMTKASKSYKGLLRGEGWRVAMWRWTSQKGMCQGCVHQQTDELTREALRRSSCGQSSKMPGYRPNRRARQSGRKRLNRQLVLQRGPPRGLPGFLCRQSGQPVDACLSGRTVHEAELRRRRSRGWPARRTGVQKDGQGCVGNPAVLWWPVVSVAAGGLRDQRGSRLLEGFWLECGRVGRGNTPRQASGQ